MAPGYCVGNNVDNMNCNSGPCNFWTSWGQWSVCSLTCGSGQRTRTRACENPNSGIVPRKPVDSIRNGQSVLLANISTKMQIYETT